MRRVIVTVSAAAWLAACAGIAGGPNPATVAGYDWAGLETIEMRGIDLAAVDPLVDFGGYSSMIVDPVEVTFAAEWEPTRPASSFDYSERDLQRLKEDVGKVVREGFEDKIGRGDRYPLADAPGPGVLRIRAQLVDVRLNAPDLPTAARTEQYARSAGEWTLVADLVDAESGAVVGRLVDRWVDPEEQYLKRYTRADNTLALWRATRAWALAVRRHLEVAAIRNRMEGTGEGLRSTGGG